MQKPRYNEAESDLSQPKGVGVAPAPNAAHHDQEGRTDRRSIQLGHSSEPCRQPKAALLASELVLLFTPAGSIALEPITVEREEVGTENIDRQRQRR